MRLEGNILTYRVPFTLYCSKSCWGYLVHLWFFLKTRFSKAITSTVMIQWNFNTYSLEQSRQMLFLEILKVTKKRLKFSRRYSGKGGGSTWVTFNLAVFKLIFGSFGSFFLKLHVFRKLFSISKTDWNLGHGVSNKAYMWHLLLHSVHGHFGVIWCACL